MSALPADILEKKREVAKIGIECFNSFYFFFKTFWPEMSGDKFVDAPHIKYLCDKLQGHAMKVMKGEFCNDTVIINVPPNSSKSTIVTIALGAWVWLHAPNLATTNVSYSARLSERHAKKARSITDSKKWHALFDDIFIRIHGKPLEIVVQNQNEMINNFKGERFNSSVGAAITGMHADIIAKDDMQNPQEAKSDTMRENANDWDDETLSSRHKNPMCWLDIIIAQRLHAEDLTGHTLNKNIKIYQYQLPSEITNASKVIPEDAMALYTDGILDPNRRPKFVLETEKARMGSAAYTCQFLQAPFNLEEQDIKPSMFEIVESVKDDIVWDLWIDGAFTEKNENDPSGIDLIARVGNDIVVKQSYDVRKKLPDLLAFIVELESTGQFDKEKSRIFVEPKASGTPLCDYIEKETEYNFVRLGEDNKQMSKLIAGGKKARHEMIKPKAESRRIKLLKGNWNDEFITQICGFPKASHDEHVDNLGYAISHYYMNESTFVEDWAIRKLEKTVPGAINIQIESSIEKYKVRASFTENDKGDIQLFDIPNSNIWNYRYICTLVLRAEGERGGKTVISVFDRTNSSVVAYFESEDITPQKAGKKALEMAALYDNAKLVVAVQKESGIAHNEENDLSHMAIAEIRKTRYDNLYSRITPHNIKLNREREYGFVINQSTTREVYYNLKEQIETNKIQAVNLEVLDEIKLLERKKETGEVNGREGYQVNSVLCYSICLKVHEEMYDKPKVKKTERW